MNSIKQDQIPHFVHFTHLTIMFSVIAEGQTRKDADKQPNTMGLNPERVCNNNVLKKSRLRSEERSRPLLLQSGEGY